MKEMVEYMTDNHAGRNEWSPFSCLDGFDEVTSRAVAIQFPIALASFLETVENVEAAHLEGDSFNVNEAMLADGLGTMFGAMMGAVMPTTVYIGHKRHKTVNARYAYSLVNGILYFILMMSGLTAVLFYIIDPVSIGVILIAVGLMIVQQSLENSASRHYPALLIGIMFVVADMLYFDHFNQAVALTTRQLQRSRGVANMAPGGGILCSIMVAAILCDLIDARFVRASIWCVISCLFSLFGLMHGNNYVFSDGSMMFAETGGDIFTTDLGEVMLSTETWPKENKFGAPVKQSDDWKYRINGPESGTEMRAFNEGWRFAVAYAVLAVFCLIHAAAQKFGKVMCSEVIMDNGVGSGPTGAWAHTTTATAESTNEGKETKEIESATV